jgi:crotonobetainyl-CoA:carnitine CoA-transferase CaiB-like acyl-CoA transferase
MVPVRTPITDLAAALFIVIGVLDAMQERARGKRGLIAREVSMAESGLAMLAAWAPSVLAGRDEPLEPTAYYGIYRAQDGICMALGALDLWQQGVLRRVAGHAVDDPVDGSLSQAQVAELVASRPSETWREIAQREGLAICRLNAPPEVLDADYIEAHLLGELDPKDPWRRLLYPVAHRRGGSRPPSGPVPKVQQLLFSAFVDDQPQ